VLEEATPPFPTNLLFAPSNSPTSTPTSLGLASALSGGGLQAFLQVGPLSLSQEGPLSRRCEEAPAEL